jgi:hypothetical protein
VSNVSQDRSPISNPDMCDIVGVRKGGGLDLAITFSGPLDDSDETIHRLMTKIENYIVAAGDAAFLSEYPNATPGPTSILVFCQWMVSARARDLITSMATMAKQKGIDIVLDTSAGSLAARDA